MDSPPPSEEESARRSKRARLLEDLFILLCILTLWPVVLGWQEEIYQYVLYAALAGLVFIFVRRINRFRAAERELDQDDSHK